MLEGTRAGLKDAKISPEIFEQTKVTADAGYHSGASVAYTQEKGIDAYIADRSHRQRDPAFADYDRYKISILKGQASLSWDRFRAVYDQGLHLR